MNAADVAPAADRDRVPCEDAPIKTLPFRLLRDEMEHWKEVLLIAFAEPCRYLVLESLGTDWFCRYLTTRYTGHSIHLVAELGRRRAPFRSTADSARTHDSTRKTLVIVRRSIRYHGCASNEAVYKVDGHFSVEIVICPSSLVTLPLLSVFSSVEKK